MALTKLTADLNIIAALDDEPNDVGGLTAAQLKAEFDEAGNTVKAYVNETLTVELDNNFATKTEVQSVVLGQIPDGSLTKTKMETPVQDSLNKADSALQTLPLHTHGNISNDGKIGSTADLMVATTTDGVLTTKTVADTKTLLGIVAGTQIATGSYTGTGAFGSGSPNSITLAFEPKVMHVWMLLSSVYYSSGNNVISFILLSALPNDNAYYQVVVPSAQNIANRSLYVKKSVDGKTVSWYSTESADNQCNATGYTYKYYFEG